VLNTQQRHSGRISEVLEPDFECVLDRERLLDALSELHQLLNEYAPPWYTQQHFEKAESVLQMARKR
jgi:hypothetical protein